MGPLYMYRVSGDWNRGVHCICTEFQGIGIEGSTVYVQSFRGLE